MEKVITSREGGLVHVRLNAAQSGNAMDLGLIAALHAALAAIDPATTRAVLFSAEGRNFSLGGDLNAMAGADDREALLRDMAGQFHAVLRALKDLGVPVVSAVNGAAAGGGLSLALAGDIVIGGESSHYMMAYTAIGLSADGGSSHALPRLVGLRLAQEMAYLNRRLDAREALAAGLITRVVPDADLLEEALAVARGLAAGPTRAFRSMKRLFDASFRTDFAGQLDAEAEAIAACAAGHDGGEGVRAFLDRRPPDWHGE